MAVRNGLVWLGLVACATGDLLVDDPCESALECSFPVAECIDIILGDGIDRCQGSCMQDQECGDQGACLFEPGDTDGLCWRTCDELDDCASGDFVCDTRAAGDARRYCQPPK